ERVEHGLVAVVDVAVAADPRPQRAPAVEIGGHRIEGLGGRADLAPDLFRELAEHRLLAREVLVEGDARAAPPARDRLDAALVVALVAEHAQRGVDDALLRAAAARADRRIVGERRAPNGAIRFGVGIVRSDHVDSGQTLRRDTTVRSARSRWSRR